MAGSRLLIFNVASSIKIILAVAGIFAAGAVTGGFVGVRVFGHLTQKKQIVERIGPNEIGARLAGQLQLTPEQAEKIKPLLIRTSDELRKVRREAFSQATALVAKLDEELSKELTEDQRGLLKEIRLKEEERRKKWLAERAERLKRNEGRPPEGRDGPEGDRPRPPRPRPTPPSTPEPVPDPAP